MKKEDNSVLIEYLGDNPMIRIVDFLIENKIFDYSKKQIMEGADISKATFFKYFGKIEKAGILKESRRFGKTKLYKINDQSPVVKSIINLGLSLANQESLQHLEVPVFVRRMK
jgi:hypothetical protein